jgi:acetyl-CoA synthetase
MTHLPQRQIDPAVQSYREACESFRWRVPARFNTGIDVCDRHAAPPQRARQTALSRENHAGRRLRYTCDELKERSHRFAQVLAGAALRPGDRFAVRLALRERERAREGVHPGEGSAP